MRKRRFVIFIMSVVLILNIVFNFDLEVEAASQNEVVAQLNSLISQYNGKTANGNQMYMGKQCKGFANWVFLKLFGVYIGPYPESANYKISNPNAQTLGIIEPGNLNVNTAKSLLQKGAPGDYIQMQRSTARGRGPHSMILVGVNDSGIEVFDCNSDGKNTIKNYTISWESFDVANRAMSLYRANGYSPSNSGTSSGASSVDVGTNFYAHIINTSTWLHTTNNGGNVYVAEATGNADQIWYFERQGDSSYKITSCANGKCMEVHNFGTANGTNVEMNTWNGNSAQRWFISGVSAEYRFRAACGNNVLDVSGGSENAGNGTNLQMWENNGTNAQRFQIWKLDKPELGTPTPSVSSFADEEGNNIKISWNSCNGATGYDIRIYDESGKDLYTYFNVQGTSFAANIPSGNYKVDIAALNTKFNCWKFGPKVSFQCNNNLGTNFYALIINTSTWLHTTNNGGNVYANELTRNSDQIWYFERQSDNSYKITSCANGKCMEVHDFGTANGTNVEMNTWNGNSAQRWFISGVSAEYRFRAACGNNVLDMCGGSENAGNGTNLQMWENNGTNAQRFQIWKLDKIKGNIRDAEISFGGENLSFDGKEKQPSITIKLSSKLLHKGTDYEVSCSDNVNAGIATITLVGKGDYTGEINRTFIIEKSDQILDAKLSSNQIEVGETANVDVNGQGEIQFHSENTDIAVIDDYGIITGKLPGTTNILVTAKGNNNYNLSKQLISITVTKESEPELPNKDQEETKPELPGGDQEETKPELPGGDQEETKPELPGGDQEEIKPELPGGDQEETKPELPGEDQEETMPELPGGDQGETQPELPGEDQKVKPELPGEDLEEIKSELLKNNYVKRESSGGKNKKVKATQILSLKKRDRSLKIVWKKIKGVTGYQIQYSTSKNFKKFRTLTIKKAKVVSKKINGLKSKKRYYVRIRAYSKIKGRKHYSEWSKVKNQKI